VARLAERELTMFRRGMAFRSTSQGLAAPLSNPAEVLLLHRHMLWKQKRSRLNMAESCQVLSVSSRQAMSRLPGLTSGHAGRRMATEDDS
jgi:hypothetical protein